MYGVINQHITQDFMLLGCDNNIIAVDEGEMLDYPFKFHAAGNIIVGCDNGNFVPVIVHLLESFITTLLDAVLTAE
jgi:hypothetical protein